MAHPQRKIEPQNSSISEVSGRWEVITRGQGSNWNRIILAWLVVAILVGLLFFYTVHPVKLTWRQSSDASMSLNYRIYRVDVPSNAPCPTSLTDTQKRWSRVGTTKKLAYWDWHFGDLFGNFCYAVTAVVNDNESTISNVANVEVKPSFRH